MKTLVIYTSRTGFTKRYAEWLAGELSADLFDLKDVKKNKDSFFDGYEAIAYAGWCMAGKVVKADWFLEKSRGWKEKRLAIVAVGASPNDNPDVETALRNLLTDEQRKYVKAFYCQGGIDYDRMNLPSKLAMKMFANSLKNKKDASDREREMGEYISRSYDISDRKYIEPAAAYLRG